MQTDIEVYIKDTTPEAVAGWLVQTFAQCSPWQKKGQAYSCVCDGIPVHWYQRAFGSWHALLFDSSSTPWADDKACAQALHNSLGIEVRCSPSTWQESDGEAVADHWLKINSCGVQPFVWQG